MKNLLAITSGVIVGAVSVYGAYNIKSYLDKITEEDSEIDVQESNL